MLLTLIPLFDENMMVKAYSLFTQRDHYFYNPTHTDEAVERSAEIEGLDIIGSVGAETLVGEDKEIFVTLNPVSLYTPFEEDCKLEPERLVFIIDNTFPTDSNCIARLQELKSRGYKLAIRKLEVRQYQQYNQILSMADYMFFDHKKMNISSGRLFFTKMFPAIKLCAGNLDSNETFEKLKKEGGYHFFEGPFYRTAITHGQHEVKPLEVNYIQLLNMVNKNDYDLQGAAEVISRDTALVISLLKVVNRMARNSEIVSIKHAAAMLGQRELRRFINTVVVGEMYSDKPNEITRLSLLRAKFAENLAKDFDLASQSGELFLMGLFSVLDLILGLPMEEALEKLKLSRDITEVLTKGTGPFAELYHFMQDYENANWENVDKVIKEKNLGSLEVYKAFTDALEWYRRLFSRDEESDDQEKVGAEIIQQD